MRCLVLAAWLWCGWVGAALAQPVTHEADFGGEGVWIGPDYWASPLQSWRREGDALLAVSAERRMLHLLTAQPAGGRASSVDVRTIVRLHANAGRARGDHWAGFSVGVRASDAGGMSGDVRHNCVHWSRRVWAGVRGDGTLFVAGQSVATGLALREPVALRLVTRPAGAEAGEGMVTATLTATQGGATHTVEATLSADALRGNVCLSTGGPRRNAAQPWGDDPVWRFDGWRVIGELEATPELAFGPILWTQYTVDRDAGLRLQVQLPPVSDDECGVVELEVDSPVDGWRSLRVESVQPRSHTALFVVPEWRNLHAPVDYRVTVRWRGEPYAFVGTIRRQFPVEPRAFRLAVLNCDKGYLFPLSETVAHVAALDPDLLFFAGDQIYEDFAGFGALRSADAADVDRALLDFHRKYMLFGWTWRELMRDRPSVSIPDDHDVFMGNIWGAGGRVLGPNEGQERGGYRMHPDWVNAVHRVITGHLPPSGAPAMRNGIVPFYTGLTWGGLGFAVLHDRGYKSGPDSVLPVRRRALESVGQADVPNAALLGEGQEAFLGGWAQEWDGVDAKVVLTQTMFGRGHTHTGPTLREIVWDFDANGWPQTARNRAVALIRSAGALTVCGDQHLGLVAHLGIERPGDAGVVFMSTGVANGWPRAWWPNGPSTDPARWIGDFTDTWGHPMRVRAAANPDPSVPQRLDSGDWSGDLRRQARLRGSGFGFVELNRSTGVTTLHQYRYGGWSGGDPRDAEQYAGFPVAVSWADQLGVNAFGTLPAVDTPGRPLVRVINEATGEPIYTVRALTDRFVPPVYADGSYTVQLRGEGDFVEHERGLSPRAAATD